MHLQGLQLHPSENFEEGRKEIAAIRAVGACFQLITVSMKKHFAKTDSFLADIIAALEALRIDLKVSVGHPWGLRLILRTRFRIQISYSLRRMCDPQRWTCDVPFVSQ